MTYVSDEESNEPVPAPDAPAPLAEPTDAMLAEGAHVLSEWLNDGAPIGERRYLEPLRAAMKAMLALDPTLAARRLF